MLINIAKADSDDLDRAGARWQQWALSIPTAINPQLDDPQHPLNYSSREMCGWPARFCLVPGWYFWERYGNTHMFDTRGQIAVFSRG
jgi:hypothetical protein